MIVLDEKVSHPGLREAAFLVRLEKEASLVAVDIRLDQDQTLEPGRADPEVQRSRSWSASRSPVSGTRTCVISSRERTVADWSVAVSKSMVTA